VLAYTPNMQIHATGFEGRIEQALYLGPATQYLVRCGGQLFHALELHRRGAKPHAEGAPVSLGWKREEALIYPA